MAALRFLTLQEVTPDYGSKSVTDFKYASTVLPLSLSRGRVNPQYGHTIFYIVSDNTAVFFLTEVVHWLPLG